MTKTLISFLQITYQEFLPSVLGTRAWKAAGLDSQEVSGQYGQYVQGVVRVVMGVQCGHIGQGDQVGQGVVRGVQCGQGDQVGQGVVRGVQCGQVGQVVRGVQCGQGDQVGQGCSVWPCRSG